MLRAIVSVYSKEGRVRVAIIVKVVTRGILVNLEVILVRLPIPDRNMYASCRASVGSE